MRRSIRLTLFVALAAGCAPDPERQNADLERAFLTATEGQWIGMIAETPALSKRVMRETPMLLVMARDEVPSVEYPLLECKGALSPAPPSGPAPFTESTGRFLLRIVTGKPGGVCQSGPVRITRIGDVLEYTFLGDTLRKIAATLERVP